jgi:hypothetical protein
MVDKRGLVVSVPIEVSGDTLDIAGGGLDRQELHFSLLFWDKLDFPTSNMFAIRLDPDSQFLADSGILQRTSVRVEVAGSASIPAWYVAAHVGAFRILDNLEPGVWSLATGERSISFPSGELEPNRGALVKLHQAIPIPDKQVPLQDILEFRTKRRAELLALRHHLEDIYQRVVSAGDVPLALNTELERLDRAITDHIKASRETRFPLRLTDLSASFNFVKFGGVLAAGLEAGLPLAGSLLTAGAAAISISKGASLRGHKATPTPFRYISSYNRELF